MLHIGPLSKTSKYLGNNTTTSTTFWWLLVSCNHPFATSQLWQGDYSVHFSISIPAQYYLQVQTRFKLLTAKKLAFVSTVLFQSLTILDIVPFSKLQSGVIGIALQQFIIKWKNKWPQTGGSQASLSNTAAKTSPRLAVQPNYSEEFCSKSSFM